MPRHPSDKKKYTNFKVVCISLYNENIEELESIVAELKAAGYTKANKSWLIRQAVRHFDPKVLPPPENY